MSLDAAKLEKVRELAGGMMQARCPACAEGGHDRSGEHLRIYPDGRFGCCVHPKDSAHRKRIFALAGNRQPGTFTVRIQKAVARTEGWSVKASLHTPQSGPQRRELENGVPSVPTFQPEPMGMEFGTLGTPIVKLRACAREELPTAMDIKVEKLKDWESAVPSVLSVPKFLKTAVGLLMDGGQRRPFLTADGTLSIPFDSPERFHWWKGGQSIAETLIEIKARHYIRATVI